MRYSKMRAQALILAVRNQSRIPEKKGMFLRIVSTNRIERVTMVAAAGFMFRQENKNPMHVMVQRLSVRNGRARR
jgi:hypothetical protein